jgi:large subunit ribosomal protein L10
MSASTARRVFRGPDPVAFTGAETPAGAKALVEFQKRTSLQIKGGYIDGTFFGPDGVAQISKMPGKKELLAQIAGGMNSILSRFAGDMRSVLSSFAGCLQALAEKQSK